MTVEQARQLLASIDTGHLFELRDRAVLGTLIYTGARVGAIIRLRIQDLRDQGNQRSLLFAEKGGKAWRSPCAMISTNGSRPTSKGPGTPIPAPPKSTTGGGDASPATSSSGSPFDGGDPQKS